MPFGIGRFSSESLSSSLIHFKTSYKETGWLSVNKYKSSIFLLVINCVNKKAMKEVASSSWILLVQRSFGGHSLRSDAILNRYCLLSPYIPESLRTVVLNDNFLFKHPSASSNILPLKSLGTGGVDSDKKLFEICPYTRVLDIKIKCWKYFSWFNALIVILKPST